MAQVAVATHTPLPMVWGMTLGQLCRYAAVIPKVLPMMNPFAGGEPEKPITSTAGALALAHSMGLEVKARA